MHVKLNLIAGMTVSARVIGKDNSIPWRIPEDMGNFKEITMGNTVVMGANTYRSIGKPLPGRLNVVLTSTPNEFTDEVIRIGSIEDIDELYLKGILMGEVFVIGGAQVYEAALPHTDKMFINAIYDKEERIEGDTFFPEFDKKDWNIKLRKLQRCNEHLVFFQTYIRKNK